MSGDGAPVYWTRAVPPGGRAVMTESRTGAGAGDPDEMVRLHTYGELTVAFTTDFTRDYDNDGAGAHVAGSAYHPEYPQWMKDRNEDWYWLGGLTLQTLSLDDGTQAMPFVKPSGAAPPDGKGPILKAPASWTWMYDDSGAHAHMAGTCYRPVPPAGYVALGDAFTDGVDGTHRVPDPATWPFSHFMCVREDYAHAGSYGAWIWNDDHSKGDYAFTGWQVSAALPEGATFSDEGRRMLLAVNTFLTDPRTSHPSTPPTSPTPYVLSLPVQGTSTGNTPAVPQLTSQTQPAEYTTATVDYSVVVPFTGITDTELSLTQKTDGSAFYTVERQNRYHLVDFGTNTSNTDNPGNTRQVSVGISDSQSSTFTQTYGLEVGYERGIGLKPELSTIHFNLSTQLGYATTTQVSVMVTETLTQGMPLPAQSSAALWAGSHRICPRRADGTYIDPDQGQPFDLNQTLVYDTSP
ncbi:conserved hypothetical protein [Streptomyces clavuligerus]|nr:conserved hypothetical protein [Streptomyces clavuligerus]